MYSPWSVARALDSGGTDRSAPPFYATLVSVNVGTGRTDGGLRSGSPRWPRLARYGDLVCAHLGMSSQQSAAAAPAMSHPEFIAVGPGVKSFLISPTCDHHDLVRAFGAQNLHRDEAWEILH